MNFDFIRNASDAGLEHQWNVVTKHVAHSTNYPGLTVEETVAFRDALRSELDFRWENGGKQQFQKMLNRTFGNRAVSL